MCPLLRKSASEAVADPALSELKARLTSLHDNCLTNLAGGLDAMTRGDLTVDVQPVTAPITSTVADPDLAEIVALFNSMLGKAQSALESYNATREDLRTRLGDRPCIA